MIDIAKALERETELRRIAEEHNAALRIALSEKPSSDEWATVCDALESLVEHVHEEECAETGCRCSREAGALIRAIRTAELQARLGTWNDCKAQADAVDRANTRAEHAEAQLTALHARQQALVEEWRSEAEQKRRNEKQGLYRRPDDNNLMLGIACGKEECANGLAALTGQKEPER